MTGDAAQASSDADLSFAQTVPRALAHRRGLSEVFVADTERTSGSEFVAAIQTPRAHALWHDHEHDFHDPLVVVEACRQAVFVGLHRYHDVPVGTPGSLQRFEFAVEDIDAYRDDHRCPLEGTTYIKLTTSRRHDGTTALANFDGRALIRGRAALRIEGVILLFPTDDFDTLRAHQRARKPLLSGPPRMPEGLDPMLVGRRDARNVVIGDSIEAVNRGEQHTFPVIVDPRNPAFFDHPNDHLPGPLIVEVYRQAAIRAASKNGSLTAPIALATRCRAVFTEFAEYEGAIECVASIRNIVSDGKALVDVRLRQFETEVAEAEVELTEVPAS
jgi:hypothetical protein